MGNALIVAAVCRRLESADCRNPLMLKTIVALMLKTIVASSTSHLHHGVLPALCGGWGADNGGASYRRVMGSNH